MKSNCDVPCCVPVMDEPERKPKLDIRREKSGYWMTPEEGESPTDLIHSRTKAQLANRETPVLSEGISFREKLNIDDFTNTE